MFSLKTIAAAGVALAAVLATPAVQAQTVEVITAGSSAQWGVFAEAAYQQAGPSGSTTRHHWTAKTTPVLRDTRPSTPAIPDEPGNIWVVWNDSGDVWAYLSIDSTVGVRGFQAVPRAHVFVPTTVATGAGANALAVWDDGSLDATLPTSISNLFDTGNGTVLTAANTDIRPEDALFATNRSIGFGYGITDPIVSSFTGASNEAHPILFALSGNDPLSGDPVVPFRTLPIGAAPIVFVANRVNTNGLGFQTSPGVYGIQDLKVTGTFNAGSLFSGAQCDTDVFNTPGNTVPSTDVAVNPILREPLSGTMNTTEFTNFVISGSSKSQETNITSVDNPLHLGCVSGGGSRYRGVGTGDEVNGIKNTSPGTSFPLPTEDQVGYLFFSYEAVASIAANNQFTYLTLDGVDGVNDPSTVSTKQLPLCGTVAINNCEAQTSGTLFNSFPRLRDGTYRSWSEYRVISDGANSANAQSLISQAQHVADFSLPDFVPFAPVCAVSNGGPHDAGLAVYRQHYTQSSVAPNDGALQPAISCTVAPRTLAFGSLGGEDTVSGVNNEAGGDVGGAIVLNNTTVPGPTGGKQ